jgi:FeS assembly protein IscX
MSQTYYWEFGYEIALALKEQRPEETLENVSLRQIYEWTIALDGFSDDPALATDEILEAIFQDWYEELEPHG